MKNENDHSLTNTTTNVESNSGDASVRKESFARFNSRVRIHIHSLRRRLADPDGISAKAAIDGLVKAGILKDDSAKEVAEITYTQEKGQQEQTIITIETLEEK